jgi:hypothetical protein
MPDCYRAPKAFIGRENEKRCDVASRIQSPQRDVCQGDGNLLKPPLPTLCSSVDSAMLDEGAGLQFGDCLA